MKMFYKKSIKTAKNFIKNLIVNLRIFSNLIKITLYFLKFFQYFIFDDVFSKLILKIKNKNKLKYPGIIFEKKWTKVCKLDLRSFAEVEENVTIKNSNRDLVYLPFKKKHFQIKIAR